ncbi:hypothetical protein [Micromonospora siamensis]|uniref:hypothetical protein n=1 Tax=Micromonospora siamensis TaxID=299152 RepID=UPI0012FE0C29|nr:hypothetical protein [Micromonospora siamensis]
MSGDGRLVRTLVACYPARWRRRYGEEYAQLLCDLRVHRHAGLILDSLLGAVRAHGGVLMSEGSPTTAVVWAVGLFTVAGLGFAKLAEDVGGRAGGAYALLVVAAVVALSASVLATAPAALAAVRADRRRWWHLAVPFVGVPLWYGVLRVALAISAGHPVHSAPNVAAFALVTGVGIAVVGATALAATRVLRQAPAGPPTGPDRIARTVVVAGMGVATGAAAAWGLRVRAVDPAVFRGADGILATPFISSWIAVVAALAAATALAATHRRRRPTTPR